MNYRSITRLLLFALVALAIVSRGSLRAEDVRPPTQFETEALVKAAATGQIDEVRTWIAEKIDLDVASKQGVTAVEAAKLKGYAEVVELLVTAGAEDTAIDSEAIAKRRLVRHTKQQRPGIAVMISRGNETVFSFAGGYADLSHQVPVKLETKFRIGSVTKQFAAAAILKLEEQGKLKVDDTLAKYFPEFPRADEVTIHHLLTHTSGIKSFTSLPEFLTRVTSQVASEEVVETFKDEPYDFDPGEKFLYNNSGYFLLGLIVEKVSDKSFAEFLQDEFFTPLKMNNSGVHDSTVVMKDEARGYSWADNKIEKAHNWDMSWAGAAGNIYSTVGDLAKWNRGLYGNTVLKQATLDRATTPVETRDGAEQSYGYGLIADNYRGTKRISHSGGLHGFLSQLTYFPEHDLTIAVFHNAMPPAPGLAPGGVAEHLAEAFLWDKLAPQETVEIDEEVDTSKYTDFVGEYNYGGAVLSVTTEDEKLFAQLTGQQRFEIFPQADEADTFVWKVVPAKVKFLRADNGDVTSARHTQNGATFTAERIESEELIEIDEEALDRFVGQYRYPGRATLSIRRDGKKLFAKMTGQQEFQIYAVSPTRFVWKVVKAEIEFKLNEANEVIDAVHKQAGATLNVKRIEP